MSSPAAPVVYCRRLLSFAGSFTSRCFLLERKGRSGGEEEERGAGVKRRRDKAAPPGSLAPAVVGGAAVRRRKSGERDFWERGD